MQDKVKEYALQLGFKGTELLGQWQGFDVYVLFNPENAGKQFGVPQYLLVQNGEVMEFVESGGKRREISYFFSYLYCLDDREVEILNVYTKNLSPEEYANINGCTSVRLLGKFKGHNVYSMYSPTDEWIERESPCYLLVKNGVVVKKIIDPDSIDSIVVYWIENEYREDGPRSEDVRFTPEKMYSFDEDLLGDDEVKPRTVEDMRRFVMLYEGVFGDDFLTWRCNPKYVCAAIEYCIKTDTPQDQTLPEGVIL